MSPALVVLALAATPSAGAAEERAAVLAVADALFDAVASRNPDHWRAVLAIDGVSTVMLESDEAAEARIIPNAELIASMQPVDAVLHERWTSEPQVRVQGDTASIVGPFDFWRDGVFSHCGVNMIDLEKRDGRWIAVDLSWTQLIKGCPTADGPPPPEALP